MKLWKPSIFRIFLQQFKRMGGNLRYSDIAYQLIDAYIKLSM